MLLPKTASSRALQIWQTLPPNSQGILTEDFLRIGFSHHILILSKVKNLEERSYYIHHAAAGKLSLDELKASIAHDDYHHQGSLPNNFLQTLPAAEQAFRAINTFKDEYLLDYINVEELGIRDKQDVDEQVVENAIMCSAAVWKSRRNRTRRARNISVQPTLWRKALTLPYADRREIWLNGLLKGKKLRTAGTYVNNPLSGLSILSVLSADEAETIMKKDPYVKELGADYQVIQWDPIFGEFK